MKNGLDGIDASFVAYVERLIAESGGGRRVRYFNRIPGQLNDRHARVDAWQVQEVLRAFDEAPDQYEGWAVAVVVK
jgi:hypothetical protein